MSSNQPSSTDAPPSPWRLDTQANNDTSGDADDARRKKADLASQLVAQAKKKQARAKKAALAAQLVDEAKKKHAAEAKKKHAAAPKKAAPKKAASKKAAPKKAAPKKAAPKKSLADRTRRNVTMSAKDALAAALAAEAVKETKEASPKRSKAKRKPAPAPVAAAPVVADPTAIITKALPKATLQGDLLPVHNVAVFTALWKANRSRALHTNDIQGIVTANVLIEAVGRVHLVAAKVSHEGHDWAVWVDTASGTLIAAATPADIYLTGL